MENEVAAIAITPDGKRAFAAMNLVNKIGVLAIDGQKVTYDKTLDIPSAFNPYNIDVTPDGKYVVSSHTGARGLNADAEVTIDTSGAHPHVVDIMAPGTGAEGFAISPNGKWAVTPLIEGSGAKPDAWNYMAGGHAALMSIGPDGKLTLMSKLPIGALPEGVAFSPNSEYVYIGNYIDKSLQVFRISGGKLVAVETMPLPGQPASIRGPAR
jgi:DNA-binding beta-propeller fold protein YncE